MFTGIIKEVGQVKKVKKLDGGCDITIICDLARDVQIDQSININGVCHTVTTVEGNTFSVKSVDETLRKTTTGNLEIGKKVNLEPALHPNQLLDGHLVQGHVDAVGKISAVQKEGSDWLISIQYDQEFRNLIVGRGSITVNGVSLTVAKQGGSTFTVAIIPYTFEHTTFKNLKEGNGVNLEFDILGKYVVRYLQNSGY